MVLFVVFLNIFVVTFTLSKSPLVKYFILFMILRIYMKGAIKWKYFLMFSTFAFFSFGISISSQFNQYLYNSTVFILLFIFLLSFLCAKCLRVLKK